MATEASKKENPHSNASNQVYFTHFHNPILFGSHIFTEHDELRLRKITFKKQDFEEAVSDPIQLSPARLEKIKTAFQTLNFLDSTEN